MGYPEGIPPPPPHPPKGGQRAFLHYSTLAFAPSSFFAKKITFFRAIFLDSGEDFKCKRQVHARKKVKKIYERSGQISVFRLIFGYGKRNQVVGSGGHRSVRRYFNGGLRHKRIQQGAESGTQRRRVRVCYQQVLSRNVQPRVWKEVLNNNNGSRYTTTLFYK